MYSEFSFLNHRELILAAQVLHHSVYLFYLLFFHRTRYGLDHILYKQWYPSKLVCFSCLRRLHYCYCVNIFFCASVHLCVNRMYHSVFLLNNFKLCNFGIYIYIYLCVNRKHLSEFLLINFKVRICFADFCYSHYYYYYVFFLMFILFLITFFTALF